MEVEKERLEAEKECFTEVFWAKKVLFLFNLLLRENVERKNINNSMAQMQVLKQMIIFLGSIAQLLTINTAGITTGSHQGMVQDMIWTHGPCPVHDLLPVEP